MGLLDWLTDGLGSSMGQDATGTGAMLGQTSPDTMGLNGPPMQPVTPTPPVAPTPALDPTAPLPQGTDPMTAGGSPPNGPGLAPPPVPLPAPRPPGADAGLAATPPNAAPTSGTGMPPGPPTSITPSIPDTSGTPGPNGALNPATGFLGRALGLDANRERSVKGALGAGLKAAGNSAGKSPMQALASGAGEGLEGGQKATDTGYDQRLKSLQLAVSAQSAGDKAAYNKNYAEYLKGKLEADTDKTTPGAKKGAWNKPDSQKFIDAQNALAKDPEIRASQKMLEQAAKTGEPADIAKATAAHNALIQQKQGMYLAGVGLDPAKIQANIQNPPGTPQNPHVVMNKQDFDTYVKPGQAYKNPADGKIYIRKTEGAAGSDQPAAATTAPSAPAPPGPMPGTAAEED